MGVRNTAHAAPPAWGPTRAAALAAILTVALTGAAAAQEAIPDIDLVRVADATGDLWCGDVGQDTREEIDLVRRGQNYGGRIMEGFLCTPGVDPHCDARGLTLPVIDYRRTDGVSVTGGYVYRGSAYPALQGVYLYGDFGSGNLWDLRYSDGRVTTQRRVWTRGPAVTSFGEDADGELYVAAYEGSIYRAPSDSRHPPG